MTRKPKFPRVAIAPYTDLRNNAIEGTPAVVKNSSVKFAARDCRLVIASGVKLVNCEILFDAPGGYVSIGRKSRYQGRIRVGLGCRVEIGRSFTTTNPCHITTAERTSVTIGDDCMFATGNEIRTDDAHAIYDMETGERLNHSRSITIGNHVWLAFQSVVLGGSSIGDGSVIGYRALVKGEVPPNSVAVGSPARVVRSGIIWKRPHLSMHPPHFFPCINIKAESGPDDEPKADDEGK